VLRSMEMDILTDGTPDLAGALREDLDRVLGAFHSKLQSREDETGRYLAALRLPAVHVMAHPTTRIFGRRGGLQADWHRVFAEAAERGKAIEIDATMWRQDVNTPLAEIAVAEGVRWFTIGTDAHSEGELDTLPIGFAIARFAGVPADRILNLRTAAFVRDWARSLNESHRGNLG